MIRRPPRSPLCPCATLFRSLVQPDPAERLVEGVLRVGGDQVQEAVAAVDGVDPAVDAADLDLVALGVARVPGPGDHGSGPLQDRKSTRLNSSHANISYAVFC